MIFLLSVQGRRYGGGGGGGVTAPDPNLVGKSSNMEVLSATSWKLANFQKKDREFCHFQIDIIGC